MIARLIPSFIMLAAVAACKLDEPQPPVAEFRADSSECFAPCRVAFTDLSRNTSVYTWTHSWWFRDSTASFAIIPNPVYEFHSPGEYTVMMSISNPVYGTDTTTQMITIKKKL